ncbi:dihydroorotate dehydrogenase (quinone) [Paenibacillus oenotherae]|uniref:Dihydroorotate dehydrogenase (Quinone) n=1 Tax=Paenibacillus oenotherae TaxID=1435645 RepID=A0ABS7D5N8_9BACL|nr:dihydroorotate dehydrogenase (quinone) [Paenibacillus oenotherae]MBW7475225.1 dihydroorotate dehydrogenase (quinone) [Paenibacillus oenotherae]
MNVINDKYYEGYEGEGEIQFIRYLADGNRFILRIWDGFFDKIMSSIDPEPDGWTGLAYFYHVEEPWWEKPWEIPDKEVVLKQFEKIDTSNFDDTTKDLLNELCVLLLHAQKCNEVVMIADE